MKKKKRKLDDYIKNETGEVPLYRSYGVTKRVRPFVIFLNMIMAKLIFIMIMLFALGIIVINAVVFFLLGGIFLSTVMTVALIWFILAVSTRVLRRRWGFLRKFKKFCVLNDITVEHKRGFFKAMRWSGKADADMIVKTRRQTYAVKFVTPKKPLSSLVFGKNEIRYTRHARRNIFSLMLDRKDKSEILPLAFPDIEGERVIIVNPRPRDIFVKNYDGVVIPTGSGERIYGYTIYTGTGFIDALCREN